MNHHTRIAVGLLQVLLIMFSKLTVSMGADSNGGGGGLHSVCQSLDPSPTLTLFIDELPIPESIDISNGTQLTLGIYKITRKLHSELPPTTLYAYGTSEATAMYPGPTLVATRHKPSFVRYENHLADESPFLIVDRTIHWANPPNGGVPTVTHLHGAEAPGQFDGHPDAWFTQHGDKGPGFVTQNYTYPNSQPAALLWYHDHSVGITRLNVLAGLTGLYMIRSPADGPPHLPSGIFEVPLIISDRTFWANGSINFPDIGDSPDTHPNWCPEYFGDTILVNGKAWPFLTVYPAMYRFRFLNAANARFFILSLSEPSLNFVQIGTDGGFLPHPMTLTNLTLAPAYRADVIIDFSTIRAGSSVYLNNSGVAPFPSGDPSFSPVQVSSVLEFRVVHKPHSVRLPVQRIPSSFGPEAEYPCNFTTEHGDVYRSLTLLEFDDANGSPIKSVLNNQSWTDAVTETPKPGSVEIWDIINLTPDAHPIHLHLIDFLAVSTQEFDQTSYDAGNCSLQKPYPNPESCFIEAPQAPDESQVGWKDTIIVYPSVVTRFWTKWTPRLGGRFPFDPTSFPGYVWHCHILDHEDNDMMRPMQLKF